MKSHNDKQVVYSLLALALVAGFSGMYFFNPKASPVVLQTSTLNSAAAIVATQNLASASPAPETVSLGFVGDIMMDRNVRANVDKNLGGDYSKLFANAGFLKEPDIMFANLEGPASDKGTDKHNLYSFRMDPAVIPVLKSAGIDVVSFDNNHVADWGRPAFEDTITRLRSAGILVCGAGMNKTEAETPAIVEENGISVGYLCFTDVGPNDFAATDTQSGILLASDPDFNTIIKNAAAKVDTLVVSFHWGVEYETVHDARQETLAKEAIADGASMVEGEHPHVPEDITSYSGVPVAYSLGNFIFDQYFSDATMHGMYLTATAGKHSVTDLIPHTTVLDKNSAVSLETADLTAAPAKK